ncbi:MAG TPA: xylulokinase [Anaeromyxobacter sp.]|nr:xylulokinase [Anaeromyxobacter sp.]
MTTTGGTRACFLGVDVGTSACKVIAVDEAGAVVARAVRDYPLSTPRPGWAEQNPADWWRATEEAMKALSAALPAGYAPQAIGLCGQMHGLVPLDGGDRVVRPAILWCDNRTGAECEELTEELGGLSRVVELINNRFLPGYTAGKIVWMRKHEPKAFEQMRRFLNPKDYIRLKMTGNHATEVADASGTALFDVRHRRWSAPVLEAVGLRADQVPPVFESQVTSGKLRAEVASSWGLPPGLPVVGGGGDGVTQITSMGIVSEGPVGVIFGTAGVVGGAANRCPDNKDGLLQVFCGNSPDRWNPMGCTLNGAGSFQWLFDVLSEVPGAKLDFDALVRVAEAAPAGSDGLLFLPHLMGERCPQVAPEARGALVGLTRAHHLSHLVRGVMEGIVLNIRAVLELIVRGGVACTEIRASGGATASPFWMSLLADGLGRDVVTVTGASEGGAYGAALIAGVGVGAWSDLERAVAAIQETTRMKVDPGRAALYQRQLLPHGALFSALEPIRSMTGPQ